MNMNPPTYTIPAPLMQAIISTLGALPWRDVHQLMGAVVSEVQRQEAQAAESPKPADAEK